LLIEFPSRGNMWQYTQHYQPTVTQLSHSPFKKCFNTGESAFISPPLVFASCSDST
jgi:hypothetical protein